MISLWLFISCCFTAVAGPWVHAPGEGYTRAGYRYYASQEGYTEGQATGLQYSAHSANVYTEWGLPGRFQVIGDLPFIAATQRAADGFGYHHQWTGDLRVQLDWAALADAKGTVGVEVRAPTYRRPSQYTQGMNFPDAQVELLEERFPALGDPCVDVTVKWMMGIGLKRGWFGASLGPRFRTNRFRHQIWGSMQGGVWAVPERLTLGVYTEGALVIPLGNEFLPSREWLYGQFQIAMFAPNKAPGWALEAGVGGIPVARNTSRGIDVTVGVSYRRQKER